MENARALERRGFVCGGVADDTRRRCRHCASDWHDPVSSWAALRLNVSAIVCVPAARRAPRAACCACVIPPGHTRRCAVNERPHPRGSYMVTGLWFVTVALAEVAREDLDGAVGVPGAPPRPSFAATSSSHWHGPCDSCRRLWAVGVPAAGAAPSPLLLLRRPSLPFSLMAWFAFPYTAAICPTRAQSS